MSKYRFRKILTGIEINTAWVNAVQIESANNEWHLLGCNRVPLPEKTVLLSYREKNIQDHNQFIDVVKEALEPFDNKVSSVGLSVPSEIIKITIQKFDDLPETHAETKRMIAWWTEKNIHLPANLFQISFHPAGDHPDGGKNMFIAIGIKDVILDYELIFKKINIDARVIRPAGINQFNFFVNGIPSEGATAYLGIFENYLTFFVFENGQITFYHGVKTGLSNLPLFLENVDRTIRYYLKNNPDNKIEKLYIGSQAGSQQELRDVFENLSDMEISVCDEAPIIKGGEKFKMENGMASFVSAIGAAQSLVQ